MTLSEWACPRAVSRSVCENADMREKVVICVMSEAEQVFCLLYYRCVELRKWIIISKYVLGKIIRVS